MIWPLSWRRASSISVADSPSPDSFRNSSRMASVAWSAVPGWVPMYTPACPADR